MNTLFIIWISLMISAVLLVIIRFVKGPILQDRVISLDMFTTITTGMLVLLSLKMDSSILLDISVVYAILSFVSILVIARFIESEGRNK